MEEEFEQKKEEKRGRGKVLLGMFLGILVSALFVFLYRGYFTIHINGEALTITLPTYYVFHDTKEGKINRSDVDKKLTEMEYWLDTEYLYDTDSDELTEGIYRGVADAIQDTDPYAAYYSREEFAEQMSDWQGSYSGIGVVVSLDQETGGVYVVRVMDGPAREAGMKAGDIIVGADGVDLRGMDLDQATSGHIKGTEGTFVELTVLRGDEEIVMKVERRKIDSPTVYHSFLESGGKKFGYLYVSQFAGNTLPPFAEAVDDIREQKADGMIIDLRDDPGGDMNVCLDMVDYLLPDDLHIFETEIDTGKSLLLSVVDKNGNADRYMAGDGHAETLPVVILVNENSASAAEIFTGVMRCYGCQTVGTKTYGKGIVQTVRTLSDLSGFKYTSAEYVLPDGTHIHGEGITPDHVVEPDETFLEKGGDPENPDPEIDNQLRKALEVIGAIK